MAVRETLASANIYINELKIHITLGNSEAIAMAVHKRLGVGFISDLVIDTISRKQIAKVKIEGIYICRDIYLGRNIR
jgi:hypothetical protein